MSYPNQRMRGQSSWPRWSATYDMKMLRIFYIVNSQDVCMAKKMKEKVWTPRKRMLDDDKEYIDGITEVRFYGTSLYL